MPVCGFKSFRSMCMCPSIFACLYMSMLYPYFYGLPGYHIHIHTVPYVLPYMRFTGTASFKSICYGSMVLNTSACRNVDMGCASVM